MQEGSQKVPWISFLWSHSELWRVFLGEEVSVPQSSHSYLYWNTVSRVWSYSEQYPASFEFVTSSTVSIALVFHWPHGWAIKVSPHVIYRRWCGCSPLNYPCDLRPSHLQGKTVCTCTFTRKRSCVQRLGTNCASPPVGMGVLLEGVQSNNIKILTLKYITFSQKLWSAGVMCLGIRYKPHVCMWRTCEVTQTTW